MSRRARRPSTTSTCGSTHVPSRSGCPPTSSCTPTWTTTQRPWPWRDLASLVWTRSVSGVVLEYSGRDPFQSIRFCQTPLRLLSPSPSHNLHPSFLRRKVSTKSSLWHHPAMIFKFKLWILSHSSRELRMPWTSTGGSGVSIQLITWSNLRTTWLSGLLLPLLKPDRTQLWHWLLAPKIQKIRRLKSNYNGDYTKLRMSVRILPPTLLSPWNSQDITLRTQQPSVLPHSSLSRSLILWKRVLSSNSISASITNEPVRLL